MTLWKVVKDICEIENPCTITEDKLQLMTDACREMAAFHNDHCPEINHLYKRHHFSPSDIKTYKDLTKIPPLGVSAMKRYLLTSMPEETAVLKLTSSGTKGIKTQIWFDQDSLDRVQRMLDVFLEQEGMVSDQPTNYLIFNYDPEDAKDLGVAFSDANQMRFAPIHATHYTVKKDSSGEWFFDTDKALEVLEKYSKETFPVRIFGMPAFIHEFVRICQRKNLSYKLPQGSLMITGGGWKASEDKMITRAEFRAECEGVFGIDEKWQRDAYGMAEHSAPYFECSAHRFHVAVFNCLLLRDPETMEVVPKGEQGLMELITPFNAIMPTLALLTTDWAKEDLDPCPCGHNSPTFTLLGRAGISKHKGCAIHADDIVKREAGSK